MQLSVAALAASLGRVQTGVAGSTMERVARIDGQVLGAQGVTGAEPRVRQGVVEQRAQEPSVRQSHQPS
jgi:hypothetical protein